MKLVENKNCQLLVMLISSTMVSAGFAFQQFILGGIGSFTFLLAFLFYKRYIIDKINHNKQDK